MTIVGPWSLSLELEFALFGVDFVSHLSFATNFSSEIQSSARICDDKHVQK